MPKQQRLVFIEEEQLGTLWKAFPEAARSEVTQHYARVMARTAVQRIRQLQTRQEADDEPVKR